MLGIWRQKDKIISDAYARNVESADEAMLAVKKNRYQSFIAPMLRKVPELRVIGLVRHPCAVLNSWRKNSKEFPEGPISERNGVTVWAKVQAPRIILVIIAERRCAISTLISKISFLTEFLCSIMRVWLRIPW